MTRVSGEWLTGAPAQAVFDALADHALYVVGGCVRNALMGVPVTDVDLATDARPEVVMAAAEAAGLNAIPTGIEHGTVTVVSDGIGHEITTYRADIETDGRRAVVRFSDTMDEDAQRRDFTMNALYADRTGQVFDPTGRGLDDLAKRHVRFIGDPGARITEDYLRILRYFRFFAWYGKQDDGIDADTLAAMAEHADGLEGLSRERIGAEVMKLLAAPNPSQALGSMEQSGLLARILPGAATGTLFHLIALEDAAGATSDPTRRLAALAPMVEPDALRLSRQTARQLSTLTDAASGTAGSAELGYRLGLEAGLDAMLLRHAMFGMPWDAMIEPVVAKGASATFPIAASDIQPTFEGKALGDELKRLESVWIASDFAASKADLLGLK